MAMIDLHTHVMPAVDDGAASTSDAVAALGRLREGGATGVAATPHVEGSLTLRPAQLEQRLATLDVAWESLCRAAGAAAAGVRLERGAEVMLDAPDPDLSDPRLRIAGTRYVLVEFGWMMVPPAAPRALASIVAAGYTPVLAHPERYSPPERTLEPIVEWREAGALLQVNCGSLVGRHGERAQRIATAMLERGLIDLLASDYHGRGEPPLVACAEALTALGGTEQRELLLSENPRRLLDGEQPLAVPPLERPGRRRFWPFG
jgi:protein-tyrosine phosphatase